MFKKVMFQHQRRSSGVTGALYTFGSEIVRALNVDRWQIQASGNAMLEPVELVARVEAATGGHVTGLWVDARQNGPCTVFLSPPPGERRGPRLAFDPYTGRLLGESVGQEFFRVALQLHRFLAIGEVGKQIAAASTVALIFFCLSGLYLRWSHHARPLAGGPG